MSVIIGSKVQKPKGDFGGDNLCIKFHKTESQRKLKLNIKLLQRISAKGTNDQLLVPIYLNKDKDQEVKVLIGIDYTEGEHSKKLPVGKVSKSGFVTNQELVEYLDVYANDAGEMYLREFKEDERFEIHATGGVSGRVHFKTNELADIIAKQYDIKLNSFVAFELLTEEPVETVIADEEPKSDVNEEKTAKEANEEAVETADDDQTIEKQEEEASPVGAETPTNAKQ